ncbi:E3 ubiquitin-protein ligase MBR2-like [Arachis ipaensis]|uniref:E3 ubiquitin-protein ligase MBR2-like n=1 Tax=Arachis ipaensis TaxID=130454 RepID=UPI000A2B13EA|nr:E3 ubiquitin-protein ligase MBR2-like [Arachis ipaensis]
MCSELLILDYSIVLNLLDNIEEEEDDADMPQQFYEELLILDYSIVLNLLDNIEEEEDDADMPQQFYEYLGDGQRVTNPDLGLTETEVAVCIGREIFRTVGGQPQNIDACGICQEDYVHGEELGRLDCAHRYHLSCIRQWLLIKNRCPICKKMALTIIDLEDDEDDDE